MIAKPCPVCGQTTEWSIGHSAKCMKVEDQTIEQLVQDVNDAITDAKAEFPDLNEDDVAYELVNAVTYGQPARVVAAVKQAIGF